MKSGWPFANVDPVTARIEAPHQRIEKLRALAKKAETMTPEDHARYATQLAQEIGHEQDALVRAQIVRTLGKMNAPAADEALSAAMADPDHEVRLACCTVWGDRGGAESAKLLGEMLRNDADQDVRLAATRALGQIQDPTAIAALGDALDDRDPALQWRAVQSLRSSSGRDLGDNVDTWRLYVRGEYSDPPTLAERLRKLF